jgi:hypothetical protein
LDRCASAWLIKRFIDLEAVFEFIDQGEPVPSGAKPFVLPGAEINPVEGSKTTFDVLVDKHQIVDSVVGSIRRIIQDFEVISGEDLAKLTLPETAGVFKITRGLARTSKTDDEILSKAFVVFDSLYAELEAETKKR